jgi:hypothetical protein
MATLRGNSSFNIFSIFSDSRIIDGSDSNNSKPITVAAVFPVELKSCPTNNYTVSVLGSTTRIIWQFSLIFAGQ